MKRTEFYEDIITNQEDAVEAEDTEERFTEDDLDQESWQDWHSQALLNAYYDLEHSCQNSGLKFRVTFNEFCNFMYGYNK